MVEPEGGVVDQIHNPPCDNRQHPGIQVLLRPHLVHPHTSLQGGDGSPHYTDEETKVHDTWGLTEVHYAYLTYLRYTADQVHLRLTGAYLRPGSLRSIICMC